MNRILIVFAKKPEPEKVKTRLVPPLTFEQAKELYTCFLKDAMVQYSRIAAIAGMEIVLMITPESAVNYFHDFINEIPELQRSNNNITVTAQSGADLGEKIFNAFSRVIGNNTKQAIVIGTDHPTLPDEFIIEGFEELEKDKVDCVIGPAEDGGFYLLGLKTVQRDDFKDIAWSTKSVFEQTCKNFLASNKTAHILPQWYDVDDEVSLNKMTDEILRSNKKESPLYSKIFVSQMKTAEV